MKSKKHIALSGRLLRFAAPPDWWESILGDLKEEGARRALHKGIIPAKLWFWGQAVGIAGRFLIHRMRQSPAERRDWNPPRTRRKGVGPMQRVFEDFRYCLRMLRKAPGFAILAVLTLALGIGANTAIFSVVNAVLISPLPYPDPDRLVRIWEGATGAGTVSPPNFADFRSLTGIFLDAAAHYNTGMTLTGEGAAQRLSGVAATPSLFSILGINAEIGRVFRPDEAVPGNEHVVLLSHGLWRRAFGGDRGILGRDVQLEGESYRVVGVMPEGFRYPDQADLWVPAAFTTEDMTTQRGAHYLAVLARLRPGVTLKQAQAQVEILAMRLEKQYPKTNTGMRAHVVRLRDDMVGDYRTALLVLVGAVGLVLLIACANVANLFLMRAVDRERELAVRTALGARRIDLIRLLLTESSVLAVLGGLLGLLLASWISGGLVALQSEEVPLLDKVGLNGAVLAFATGISLLTVLLFGVFPARRLTRPTDLGTHLKEGRGQSEGRTGMRIRSVLIVGQISLALLLVSGAGLLGRSFLNLRTVNLGFRTDHILTFSISLPDRRFPEPAQLRQFAQRMEQAAKGIPETQEAGLCFGLPLTGFSYYISVERIDGHPGYTTPEEEKDVQVRVATPGYLRALGIPLMSGRLFEDTDREGGKPVALLNESAARLLFAGQNPLGHTLEIGTRLGGKERLHGEVVGVIADVKHFGPAADSRAEAWFVHAQYPARFLSAALRTSGNPETAVAATRKALAEIDPEVPMFHVRTMDQLLGEELAQPRFYTLLLGFFSATALLLAAIGIYGVIAYAVGRRTREIGIRMALGAGTKQITSLVVYEVARLVAAGVLLGIFATIAATRLMQTMLFHLSPTDPSTLAASVLFLVLVALFAGWLPARRAANVDPVTALHSE